MGQRGAEIDVVSFVQKLGYLFSGEEDVSFRGLSAKDAIGVYEAIREQDELKNKYDYPEFRARDEDSFELTYTRRAREEC